MIYIFMFPVNKGGFNKQYMEVECPKIVHIVYFLYIYNQVQSIN